MTNTNDCVIVYASVHHGNTRVVAEAMADAIDARALEVGEAALEAVNHAGLVGLGAGAYFGSHHRSLLSFAEQLPPEGNLRAFIFSTSGTGLRLARLVGRDYHKRLRNILRKKGIRIFGEFDCKGYDTYGPWGRLGGIAKGHPDAKELEDARAFARETIEHYRSTVD